MKILNSLFFVCCCLILIVFPVSKTYAQATPDTVLAAGPKYMKSSFYQFFWGKHYRKAWAEPVRVPYLNLQTEAGGLKPIKEGGSFQTKNLRLVNPEGKEFVLRSVDKDPSKALPEGLRKSFVASLMRDQTSVIQPYGAYIVPTLAKAAGVYHTEPKLIVIPDDVALGEFRKDFANMLALLEERPEGDQSSSPNFGNSKDVISSKKMFGKLVKNSCTHVDARFFLRARLFDMLLGDWSRREDQWRWASRETKNKGITYLAIPRDRDHAFFKFNDGFITTIFGIFKPNYQTFSPKIKNVKGLNQSGLPLDRSLLVYLNKADFIQIADSLKMQLTNDVIAKALQNWPANIYAINGKEFDINLKSRRDQLPAVAAEFYDLLAKEVEIPGTDDKEHFRITVLPKNEVKVEAFRLDKKCAADSLIGSRVFKASETKHISIFGLGNDDVFEITGEEKLKIAIQIFDGEGEDKIVNHRKAKNRKKIKIESAQDGNDFPKDKNLEIKEAEPKAKEFNGEGWLLRHRLH